MQLDGSPTQLLRAYLESALKFITGIPDRDVGQAGSDTGVSAEIRTGSTDIEVVAQTKALYTEMAEKQILKIALQILSPKYVPENLKVSDIDISITRINRDNILTKTQAGVNMQQLGMADDDIVYFMNLTNDVSAVASRMKANKVAPNPNPGDGNVAPATKNSNAPIDNAANQ